MIKVRTNLLNHSAVKKYILKKCKADRPGLDFTRVSKDVLMLLEVQLREKIEKAVWSHSSTGRTFRDIG